MCNFLPVLFEVSKATSLLSLSSACRDRLVADTVDRRRCKAPVGNFVVIDSATADNALIMFSNTCVDRAIRYTVGRGLCAVRVSFLVSI